VMMDAVRSAKKKNTTVLNVISKTVGPEKRSPYSFSLEHNKRGLKAQPQETCLQLQPRARPTGAARQPIIIPARSGASVMEPPPALSGRRRRLVPEMAKSLSSHTNGGS